MKSKFYITDGGYNHNKPIEIFEFSGGEVSVKLPDDIFFGNQIDIQADIVDSAGVMALLMVKNALDNMSPSIPRKVVLELGYVPYARQDRVCNKGEALSIKVMCNLINSLEFDQVCILDPHSDVTPALLDNVVIITQLDVLRHSSLDRRLKAKEFTLVSPDAGATKKTQDIATHYGLEVVQGIKHRDLATGALSGFGYLGIVSDKDLLIVDDICDGGGTFVGLTEKLKEGVCPAKSVTLYVSHGIFSKGYDLLLDNGIDHIYTTGSFGSNTEFHPKVHKLNW